MILQLLRALFVLLMLSAAFYFVRQHSPADARALEPYVWLTPAIALTIGVLFVCMDILAPRRKLAVFSGALFGLAVGLVIAYVLSFVVELLVYQYSGKLTETERNAITQFINLMLSVICSYLCISFILQTKDDFRFIVPYVEFSKQTKGARPMLLDTSVLIDGRIADVVNTGIIESQLIVPQFVIDELQLVADSADKLKRNRGRRGLEVMQKLRSHPRVDVDIYDSSLRDADDSGVDQKLIALAKELTARVVTNDFNLNKVAQLRGVEVMNLNELANAMKAAALPGERMSVRLVKPGEEPSQGVGYLEDGTMVVVEGARPHIGQEVEFTVTNTRQTSAGKMIFGRMGPDPDSPPSTSRVPRPQSKGSPQTGAT